MTESELLSAVHQIALNKGKGIDWVELAEATKKYYDGIQYTQFDMNEVRAMERFVKKQAEFLKARNLQHLNPEEWYSTYAKVANDISYFPNHSDGQFTGGVYEETYKKGTIMYRFTFADENILDATIENLV
jgi:predicted RNA-binding protein with EMAP domain